MFLATIYLKEYFMKNLEYYCFNYMLKIDMKFFSFSIQIFNDRYIHKQKIRIWLQKMKETTKIEIESISKRNDSHDVLRRRRARFNILPVKKKK